jgi:hypothetical protein
LNNYRLLGEFRKTFEGNKYRHRVPGLGDWVALHLYEDLYTLKKSKQFAEGVDSREKVLNTRNQRRGIKARRGDGTFGELIPGMKPIEDPGFVVARGPIANVELGVEAKFVSKAMIKQVDRVINDLRGQLQHFHRGAGNPICVAIVGVNWADYTISYEGDRVYRTNGRDFPHPIQEAAAAEDRLQTELAGKFDELLVLRYKATNDPNTNPPYQFDWVSYIDTFQDYGAALTRVSREYDTRFGS